MIDQALEQEGVPNPDLKKKKSFDDDSGSSEYSGSDEENFKHP